MIRRNKPIVLFLILWSRFRLTLGFLFTHDVEDRAVPWATPGLLFTPDVADRAVPWELFMSQDLELNLAKLS